MSLEQSKGNTALWTVAALALLACTFEAYAGFRDVPTSGKVDLIWQFAFALLTAYWAMQDARVRQIGRPYTEGLILFCFWPVMLPAYLIKSRGAKGALLAVAGTVVFLLPSLCWFIAGIFA